MPDNELIIRLILQTQEAERADVAYHQGARRRMRGTANEQSQAEKEHIKEVVFNLNQEVGERKKAATAWRKFTAKEAKDLANTLKAIDKEVSAQAKAIIASDIKEIKRLNAEKIAIAKQRAKDLAAIAKREAKQLAESQKRSAEQAAAAQEELDKKVAAITRAIQQEAAADQKIINKAIADHKKNLAKDAADTEKKLIADVAATVKRNAQISQQIKKEAMADNEEWFKQYKEEHNLQEKTKSNVLSIAAAYTGLRIASEVNQAIKVAMHAVADSAKDARDYVKGIVDEMEKARTVAVEVAGLRGEKSTARFTEKLALEAAATGTSPENYERGQKAFYAFAGQYVGKKDATDEERKQEIKDKKMSYQEAQDLQQLVTTNTNAQGLPLEDSMKLLGTVVSKRKPGMGVEDVALKHRRLLEAMKLAPGYTGPLLGQLNEVVQESVGEGGEFDELEDAAILVRSVSARNSAEASSYTRGLLRGVRDIRANKKGQADELGVTKKMDIFETIDKVSESADRIAAARGDGTTSNAVLTEHFNDIREFGGIRTAISEGLKGGGFSRTRGEMAAITKGTGKKENREYMRGEEGTAQRQNAEKLAAERGASAKYRAYRVMQRDAAITLANGGTLEIGEDLINSILTKEGSVFGQGSREEQEVKRLTGLNIEHGLKGSKEGREFLDKELGPAQRGVDRLNSGTSEPVFVKMANELERLRKLAEKNAGADGGGAAPVAAAMPAAPAMKP